MLAPPAASPIAAGKIIKPSPDKKIQCGKKVLPLLIYRLFMIYGYIYCYHLFLCALTAHTA